MANHGFEDGMLVRLTHKPGPHAKQHPTVTVPIRVDGDWVHAGEHDEWTIWAKSWISPYNPRGINPNYTILVVGRERGNSEEDR